MTDEVERLRVEEEQYWQRVLEYRVQRFAKLVALHGPESVICSDFFLVMKALVARHPDVFGRTYVEMLQRSARHGNGRCVHCGGVNDRHAWDGDWCTTCNEQVIVEIKEEENL